MGEERAKALKTLENQCEQFLETNEKEFWKQLEKVTHNKMHGQLTSVVTDAEFIARIGKKHEMTRKANTLLKAKINDSIYAARVINYFQETGVSVFDFFELKSEEEIMQDLDVLERLMVFQEKANDLKKMNAF